MRDYVKMRKCSYLLPDPGGEVVRELLDEIETQQATISRLAEELAEARLNEAAACEVAQELRERIKEGG